MGNVQPMHSGSHREISLSGGLVALVDDADFDRVAIHQWFALKVKSGRVYAARTIGSRGTKRRSLLLHRVILGCDGSPLKVDHANNDGLDCRRFNLRIATSLQNSWNRGPQRNNTTGFKGVRPTRYGRFAAIIKAEGRQIHLGHFPSSDEAARAYDEAARKYFGGFAWLNFAGGTADAA